MTHHIALLVPNTALHRDLAEHGPHRLPERLRSVDHEQHPLLGIQPPLDQVRQQRRGDGRVLGRALPQPQRDLDALGSDPERDDHHPLFELDPVDHHHRQTQIGELAGHQLTQRQAGALHKRP